MNKKTRVWVVNICTVLGVASAFLFDATAGWQHVAVSLTAIGVFITLLIIILFYQIPEQIRKENEDKN